jgi:hypothetical protein
MRLEMYSIPFIRKQLAANQAFSRAFYVPLCWYFIYYYASWKEVLPDDLQRFPIFAKGLVGLDAPRNGVWGDNIRDQSQPQYGTRSSEAFIRQVPQSYSAKATLYSEILPRLQTRLYPLSESRGSGGEHV